MFDDIIDGKDLVDLQPLIASTHTDSSKYHTAFGRGQAIRA